MDQQAEYPEEPIYEPENEEELDYGGTAVAPPLEGAFAKYLREYRLLNSLLVSLLLMIILFAALWSIVIYVAAGGEGGFRFFRRRSRTGRPKAGKTKGGQIDAASAKDPAEHSADLHDHCHLRHYPARLQRTRRQGLVSRGQCRRPLHRQRRNEQ